MRKTLLAAAALALAVGLAGAPAAQAQGWPPPHLKSKVNLSLTVSDSDGSWSETLTLKCRPTRGAHPDRWAACVDLARAGGKIPKIPAADMVCTKERAPVDVSVYGRYVDRDISFNKTYGNRCQAIAATGGHLFNF